MFHWTKTRRLGGRFKYTLLNHDTSRCSWQSRWPLNKSYLKLFDFFQVISKLYQVQISSKFITEHKVLFCASTLYHLSVSVLRWHIWWFVSNFPKLSDKFQNCFHRVHYIQHLMMDIWCRAKSVSSPPVTCIGHTQVRHWKRNFSSRLKRMECVWYLSCVGKVGVMRSS